MDNNFYTVFAGENDFKDVLNVFASLSGDMSEEQELSPEEQLSLIVRRKRSWLFGAGRMALFVALRALKIGKGDEVIVQGFTCGVVPQAVMATGAKPVFVDISLPDLNICPVSLKQKINNKTKVVIFQHTFGVAPDPDKYSGIINENNLVVIEDCAHGLEPLPIGALGCDKGLSFSSTDYTKSINTHMGGCLSVSDDAIAARIDDECKTVRNMSNWQECWLRLSFAFIVFGHSPGFYQLSKPVLFLLSKFNLIFSWPKRLTSFNQVNKQEYGNAIFWMGPFQKLLLKRQLERRDKNRNHRVSVFKTLEKKFLWYGKATGHPILRYPMLVKNRSNFLQLHSSGLTSSTWFLEPVSTGCLPDEYLFYENGQCPVAEFVCEHIINIHVSSRVPIYVYDQLTQNSHFETFRLGK